MKPAESSIEASVLGTAATITSAPSVNLEITPQLPALAPTENKCPRFYRGLLWDHPVSFLTPSATATKTMAPLPRPPLSPLQNHSALDTLRLHPQLFAIVTPIKVDEQLLFTHPNQPLVGSVLLGLRQGFWPCAHDEPNNYPDMCDMPDCTLTPEQVSFCEDQFLEEERLGRFSHPLGLLVTRFSWECVTFQRIPFRSHTLINSVL
jgi:hypothetical protein